MKSRFHLRRCIHLAGIALALTGLARAASPSAPELHAFWQQTLSRLAGEPLEALVEPVTEPLPYRKFRVTLRSLGGVHFRALLALPVQGESPARPLPAIVTAPGYGGTQQGIMLSECMRGYAILQVYPTAPTSSPGTSISPRAPIIREPTPM